MTALALVVALVATLAWVRGAPLGPPADADWPHTPRPEWYFVWLFELRRYFTGDWEFIATLVLPSLILAALVAMPVLDFYLPSSTSALLRYLLFTLALVGWAALTGASYWRDSGDEELHNTRRLAAELGARARLLASAQGVPPEGAAVLLKNDPEAAGPLLFRRHCAACHSHANAESGGIVAQDPSAPNLHGFATHEWIAGFLDPETIRSENYFKHTKFIKGEMAGKIQELFQEAGAEKEARLREQLAQVARALAAEANLPNQAAADAATILAGQKLLTGTLACTDCHKFHESGELGDAPDLTGYGSRAWLLAFVSNPQHKRFYAGEKNDRMPAFAANAANPERNLLSPRELELLVSWLRGEFPPPALATD